MLTLKPVTELKSASNQLTRQRVALGVQYDGSNYFGWQSQVHGQTVQDLLEAAIKSFMGHSQNEQVRVTTAGRTDTGVHALGQVVHFDTSITRPDWSWVRGINTFLPKDISVHWAKFVPDTFDSRYSAQERAYAYYLISGACSPPLIRGKAGYQMLPEGKSLDIHAMRQGAKYLLGTHDFSSFRSSQCQSKTPIKTLYQMEILEEGPRVYFLIRGNAFLHHMVRNLVGSLIMVGLGRQSPEWINEVLIAKSRQIAAPTFSPDGLYLTRVGYPESFEIPEPNFAVSAISANVLINGFGSGNWIKNEV